MRERSPGVTKLCSLRFSSMLVEAWPPKPPRARRERDRMRLLLGGPRSATPVAARSRSVGAVLGHAEEVGTRDGARSDPNPV